MVLNLLASAYLLLLYDCFHLENAKSAMRKQRKQTDTTAWQMLPLLPIYSSFLQAGGWRQSGKRGRGAISRYTCVASRRCKTKTAVYFFLSRSY